MARLFVSHASSDRLLVSALVDLLEGGVGVAHEAIFCSSLKGQNIKPGTYFIETIRKEIEGAECVLVFVTENFFASPFCLCELGAGWLLSKKLLPFAAPKIDQGLVKAVLEGMVVSSIESSQDLDELRDILCKSLGIEGRSTPRWNEKREQFLVKLPELLAATEARGPVARDTHEKVLRELGEYRDEYKKKEVEISMLNALVEDLKATKDRAEVVRVITEHSDAVTQFQMLSSRAKKALGKLGPVLKEAIYYDACGDEYSPDQDDFDEVKRMFEEGQLKQSANERGWVPDTSSPPVRDAVDAVSALRRWLDTPPPEEFWDWHAAEVGVPLDFSKRPFWRKHLW